MNWEKASYKIWNRFCELEDKKQVKEAENSFTDTVFIFPTSSFNDFCKNIVKLDYMEVAKAVAEGTCSDTCDLSDPWCMYEPIMHQFTTDESPAGLVEYPDKLVENLMDDENLLLQLGFSKDEVEEFVLAYKEELILAK